MRKVDMKPMRDRAAWLQGGQGCCLSPRRDTPRPCRLVLLGAPGVGKGTQAELLGKKLGACHLSTGDLFRAAESLTKQERGPALERALSYMHRGELVPDATVLEMVRERMNCLHCRGGFLLDGFPRTIAQAEALEDLLKEEHLSLTAVLDYELSRAELITRLAGRRTCPNCKATYHVAAHPPREHGICDLCGAKLQQRDDDRPEAIRVRLEAYATRTAPLIGYYQKRGLLISINAEGAPEEVFQRTMAKLEARVVKISKHHHPSSRE